jgi:hypothetical protein
MYVHRINNAPPQTRLFLTKLTLRPLKKLQTLEDVLQQLNTLNRNLEGIIAVCDIEIHPPSFPLPTPAHSFDRSAPLPLPFALALALPSKPPSAYLGINL